MRLGPLRIDCAFVHLEENGLARIERTRLKVTKFTPCGSTEEVRVVCPSEDRKYWIPERVFSYLSKHRQPKGRYLLFVVPCTSPLTAKHKMELRKFLTKGRKTGGTEQG